MVVTSHQSAIYMEEVDLGMPMEVAVLARIQEDHQGNQSGIIADLNLEGWRK